MRGRTLGYMREIARSAVHTKVQAVGALLVVSDAAVALNKPITAHRMRKQDGVRLMVTSVVCSEGKMQIFLFNGNK